MRLRFCILQDQKYLNDYTYLLFKDCLDNFQNLIYNKYLNNNDKIKEYLDLLNNEWYAKQKHINKDSVVKKIISCLKQNEFFVIKLS